MVAPQLTPFLVFLGLAAAVSAVIAGYAWRSRSVAGARWLALMGVALVAWSGGYLLQLLAADVAGKLLWARVVATGSIGSVFGWYMFVAAYTRTDRLCRRRAVAVAAVVPALTVVIAWTNHLHGLVWQDPGLFRPASVGLLATTKGPWFHVTVAYGYLLVGASLVLVGYLYVRSRSLHRRQAAVLFVAAAVPFVGNAVYQVLARTTLPVDVTPVLFTVTGAVVAVGLVRFRLLDLVPVSQHRVLDELVDGVVVVDDRDRVVHVNDAAAALFGDAAVGQSFAAAFPESASLPEGVTPETLLDAAADRDDPLTIPVTVDGEQRHVDLRVSTFRDGRDHRVGRMLELRDVTEHRERAKELEEYETVFETISEPVYVLDEEGVVRMANEELASMLGTTPAEMVGQSARAFIGEDAFQRGNEVLAELYNSGKRHGTVQLTLPVAGGEEIPCETRLSLLPTDDEYRGCVGVIRDVSRRKRAETELERTSGTLESLFTAAPLAIATVDVSGTVTRWNPQAEDLFGWPADRAIGAALSGLFDHEDLASLADRVLDGEAVRGIELTLEDASGARHHVSVAAAPLPDPEGEYGGAVFILSDVSERRQRQQQVAVLNRVLRHNLRNDLTVIIGHSEMLADRVDDDRLTGMAESVVGVAQDLQAFSQKARQAEQVLDSGAERRELDLATVVPGVVEQARRDYPDAEFAVDVPDGATAAALETLPVALRNLVENAVEHNDRNAPSVSVSVARVDDDVVVEVADDGPGIPETERETLTGGEVTQLSHSTGLGLWLVNWVVSRSGGELAFEANDPRGSVVRMVLPAATTVETRA